jgi:hypothetical protein
LNPWGESACVNMLLFVVTGIQKHTTNIMKVLMRNDLSRVLEMTIRGTWLFESKK